jgi:hypothetical protein
MRMPSNDRRSHSTTVKPAADGAQTTASGRSPRHGGQRGAQEWRRALVIGAIALGIVATGGILMRLGSNPSTAVADRQTTGSTGEYRSGRVIIESSTGDCRERAFDNQTGRMATAERACGDQNASDGVPRGTLHRLNAISKSFNQ